MYDKSGLLCAIHVLLPGMCSADRQLMMGILFASLALFLMHVSLFRALL